MPGIARNRPSTTRRILGTAETSRSSLRTLSARSTLALCVAGMRLIPITTKSKTFHGSRKKLRRNTASLASISATNTATMSQSRARKSSPAAAIAAAEVSNPRITPLTTISVATVCCVRFDSTSRRRRSRPERRTATVPPCIICSLRVGGAGISSGQTMPGVPFYLRDAYPSPSAARAPGASWTTK
jgi:hypothetical protein